MHPILASASKLGMYLLAYLPIGIVLVIGLGHRDAWGTAAAFFLPLTMLYAFIGLSAYYLCLAFPIDSGHPLWRAMPAHMCAAASVGALCVGAAWLWAAVLESLNIGLQAQVYVEQPWLLFVVGAVLFWLAIALHYVMIASSASQRSEQRALESGLLAREAELKALRAQIDPHFLFNSLNSISALTGSDPSLARKMCLLLADFLRDTLRLGATQRISVGEELNVVQRYLAIEQVRLGARLTVNCTASEQARGAYVPALILQPLVENAVLHGIAHLLDGGTVTVSVERHGGTLLIRVSNPSDPDRPRRKRAGLGLLLVRQRLQSEYGAAGQLQVHDAPNEFVAEVSMPFTTTEGAVE
ncbi:MAG TPA: histidine kinase [Steroidobacteraceae bacterium]|nr:histidine kinase [Steroidobacteraceae bacterium]